MRKSVALLAACAASASAFAPIGYVGITRQTHTGVTSLDMNAGTGKLKKISAARAGVPRASNIGPADYDAAAALGIKQQRPMTYAKPVSTFGTASTKAPAKKVGLGTQPVSKPRAVAKPMSTQRVVAKPAPKPVARAAPKPVARAAPKPAVRVAPKPAPKPVVRAAPKPAPKPVARAAPAPRAARPAPTPRAARPAPTPRAARPTPTPRAAPTPSFSMPSMPKTPSFSMPSMPKSSPAPVAAPARSSGGIDLLERVETLKLLTALYNAGALTKVERAGLLSQLEKAGALSQVEKLLPLIEEYKPITLARTVLSIPSSTFYAGAAGVALADLAVLFGNLKVGAATSLLAIPVAVGLVIGGQVNGVVQGNKPVNLQSILGPRLRE